MPELNEAFLTDREVAKLCKLSALNRFNDSSNLKRRALSDHVEAMIKRKVVKALKIYAERKSGVPASAYQ